MIIWLLFSVVFSMGVFLVITPLLQQISRWLRKRTTSTFYRGIRKDYGRQIRLDLHNWAAFRRLEIYMSVAGMGGSPYVLSVISLLLFTIFFGAAYQLMHSLVSGAVLGTMTGSVPFIYLWNTYQRKQQKMATVMIPTVQNFIGFFTESENLAGAIYKAGPTMPADISGEWRRLIMDIETGEARENSILTFAERVGNAWAQDFADILVIHLETGSDIVPSLFKLINEMQNAMYNEAKRNTLLSIYRYGTMLMIVLAFLIVGFNIWIHPINKIYYFADPGGKKFVTMSILVLFGSFIGALQLGKKKI
ncbi:type II secretion system F family protein [Paenibacillus gansuensis]|uniref:Type II secretion system protein GspF domain-containing protein n=1 Tax=Paenibacillus gansuensis TaxID=306542 RepID=A0ABW5PGS2_9BACL